MTRLIGQHGSGIRYFDAAIDTRKVLAWTGGGAELLNRLLPEDSEARVRTNRHTLYANYYFDSTYNEAIYDGQKIASGLQPDRHIAFWPAHRELIGRMKGGGQTFYLAIFLDPSFMLRVASVEHLAGIVLQPNLSAGDLLSWQLLDALRSECEAGAPHGTLYAETMATALSVHLLRHHSNLDALRLRPVRGGLASRQFRRVCDYLEAHLAEDTTLAELATLVDLSPAHFCRAFKATTGYTITRWRTERRIARGKELLADPRLAITDIALACGFSDHSHFGKVFREQVGVAPSVWRRERLT